MFTHKEESLSLKCIIGEAASQGCSYHSRITYLESDSPLDDQSFLIILVKPPSLRMQRRQLNANRSFFFVSWHGARDPQIVFGSDYNTSE